MPTWPCGLRRLPIAPAYRIAGSNPRQELEVSSHSTSYKADILYKVPYVDHAARTGGMYYGIRVTAEISRKNSSLSLKPIASPLDSLPGVFFHAELLTHTNKASQHPEYLRQAVLEVINNIPIEATLIYTGGSRNEIGHTAVGILLSMVDGLLNEEMLTTAQFYAPK
ncbi:hypothetical protein AVEN_268963-1 [Araneus ventricosus]|uniref:Uncharacterized protein n=1 Tax=Araneus ventricosus TaxID=182803 RepID=A0A4Y2I1K3_ARAVE|nr:hypothetical protein AVEN_268963-1 [Araneus ventricosus]